MSNFRELGLPYRFTFIVTYKCQCRCSMCNIWQKPYSRELSLEQIEKFFKKSHEFSWINLSGGEIFLRDDILDIFRVIFTECKDLYLLDFPTNGFLTETVTASTEKILSRYNPAKLLVTVSLDGPPELHDSIRNVRGSWMNAVETFKALRSMKRRNFGVYFGMTLQDANLNSFEKTFEAASAQIAGLKRNDFHINLMQASSHYYGNSVSSADLFSSSLRGSLEAIRRSRSLSLFNPVNLLERRYQRLADVFLKERVSPVPCQALGASFFMDPAGNIYPCSMYDKTIGNIVDFDYDLNRLWRSTSRRQARSEIHRRLCPQCWTPCEAYQSILADLMPGIHGR